MAAPDAAAGDAMNPALGRLVTDPACNRAASGTEVVNMGTYQDTPATLDALYGPSGGQGWQDRRWCAPDHVAFKQLINQWGFALAPAALHPARTTGFGGFHISASAVYTSISSDAPYWKNGTRGTRNSVTQQASVSNPSVPSMLAVYSLQARKSFGFGLEVAPTVGFVPNTTILTGGADVRLALLEGFRTGLGGIFPDVAVGGGVRTITGTADFQLTTVGVDAQISKPLAIASQAVLTPWVGYQHLWIFGDSGLVDTTPATDPLGYCNYSGLNMPGNPDPTKAGVFDGQPVCNQARTKSGSVQQASPLDFNNNVVFNNAVLERHRLIFGMSYRFEMIEIGGAFIRDIVPPADAQSGSADPVTVETKNADGTWSQKSFTDKQVLKDAPAQYSIAVEVGLRF